MKEIPLNSIYKVKYNIFIDGVATDATNVKVSLSKDGTSIFTNQTATHDGTGSYSYVLPPNAVVDTVNIPITTAEGILSVTWSFTLNTYNMSVTEEYAVVTQYVNWQDFSALTDYASFIEAERVARFQIHSYCGQEFGKQIATYAVEGHNESSLTLSRRLLSLDSVTFMRSPIPRPGEAIGFITAMPWEIVADGWAIRQQPQKTKLDPIFEEIPRFRRNTIYNVTGTWGYDAVPADVAEAAKILTANLLCNDHKYVDNYINDIRMGDWQIKFADGAFQGTGSSIADSLLLNFRLNPGLGMI